MSPWAVWLRVTFYFCVTARLPSIFCSRSDANDMRMAGIAGSFTDMDTKRCWQNRCYFSDGDSFTGGIPAGTDSQREKLLAGTSYNTGWFMFYRECSQSVFTLDNRKLYKKRRAEKIDNVAALLDALVAELCLIHILESLIVVVDCGNMSIGLWP